MNYHTTVEQNLTKINFIHHPLFDKEAAKLKRRFVYLYEGIESFKRLCQFQFDPINPRQVIAPAKLHRITKNGIWTIWKVELVVKGLKPNQFPRLWFVVKGAVICLLCICTHIDNYDNNEIDKISFDRVTDIF